MTAASNDEDISPPETVLAKSNPGTTEAPRCKAEGQRCSCSGLKNGWLPELMYLYADTSGRSTI